MNAPKGEETIFAEALRLPPDERAAYIALSTNGNPELRQAVESLLASYPTGGFLEQAAAPQWRDTLTATVPVTEKPGDRVGRYKLLQQIGEGGCGVVYMAEQLEPVRRRVALKIIKLGMDTKSVIARFEAERQALAMMDHPNIAKVFDAGATETPLPASGHPLPSSDEGRGQGKGSANPQPSTLNPQLSSGRPYFVMELVRGMKITEYCDEAKLSTRARLDLFIQVCQAIQHAHQKGIIHRDLKPSNVLVAVNDGVAVPKVIDFGIAKATSGQPLTDKTLFTAFEQFIGTPAYMSPEQALLTNLDIDTRSDIYALGVLLYEMLTGRTPFDARELLAIGLDEMRRTIREQEPPRPSTRLSTLPGQELSTAAQRRGIEAPKLVTELRGDLDWIVMKALEKDRARRYETANGLAMDIQRHLSNEPVVACPPSKLYRLQKMVRRNKLAFAAGSAVAASLVIGLTLSTVLFFRERAARERTNEQAARAAEQAAIAKAVNGFLQQDLLRQADSRTQAKGHFAPDPTYLVAGKHDQALSLFEETLKLQKAKLGLDYPETLNSMNNLALAYGEAGKHDQALALHEETLKLRKVKLGLDHPDTLTSMNNLATAYAEAGKPDQVLPLFEETLKLQKAKLGFGHPDTLMVVDNLVIAYRGAGKFGLALSLSEETLKLQEAKLGLDHPDSLKTMNNLAWLLATSDSAVRDGRRAVGFAEKAVAKTERKNLGYLDTLAAAYAEAGEFAKAVSVQREAIDLCKDEKTKDDLTTRLKLYESNTPFREP